MKLRGLEEQNELSPQLLLRDTRTMGMKIRDFFKDPVNNAALMFGFAVGAYFFPGVCDFIAFTATCIFIYAYTRLKITSVLSHSFLSHH